jgi:hypothetical protein
MSNCHIFNMAIQIVPRLKGGNTLGVHIFNMAIQIVP